jgi:ubiquinone/menaquinone biosynthesis C-methylase UbiE
MAESVSFDPIAHRYDATRGYPAEVATRIARGLMEFAGIARGGNVVEIGIGTGRIALPLIEQGVNVAGVDISANMVDLLREKYQTLRVAETRGTLGALEVALADMTALPFADGRFDASVAVHALHLVPEWRRALDELQRVVKPDGVLLFGQDVRVEDDVQWRAQREWLGIVRRLGFQAGYIGARGYNAIVEELDRRGLAVRESELARWETMVTPRQALTWITERTWSRTWPVPDDIFDAAARELTAWMEREYADAMETPQRVPEAFKAARAERA